MPSYDTIIVGAGPAGCATAYDLAHAGRRVLLLDRRSFPRHKACACGLTRKTLNALRYSVDPVIEYICHEVVLQQGNNDTAIQELRVHTRNPICAMAVRERFDAFCLKQTLAAGSNGGSVTFLKIENIIAIRESDASVELDVETADGPLTFAAPVLIGADGSNGQTRRLIHQQREPGWYERGFALEACVPYSAMPAELPCGNAPTDLVFDFAPLPGGYGWLFPKGDHVNIGVGVFAASEEYADTNLRQVTRQRLADYTMHKLGVELTAITAHITGQYLGMGGDAYTPRGRVLLAGDAAGLVDQLTGEGIYSALISGQAAAAAITSNTTDVARAYAKRLRPLQRTLAFSARAARSFYREPERGFRAMRHPLLRRIILKIYTEGFPANGLLRFFLGHA